MDGNPFALGGGTPQQQQPLPPQQQQPQQTDGSAMAGNPFDPMAAPAAPVQPPPAMGVPQQQQQQQPPPYQNGGTLPEMPKDPMMTMAAPAPSNDNPFGAPAVVQPPPTQPQAQPEQRGSIYGQPVAVPGQPAGPATGAAMVVSNQQSNPYATPATPGAMIQAPQQASPWGVATSGHAPAPSASFDPFAAPPAPPPAPAPAPLATQQTYQQPSQEFGIPPAPVPPPVPAPQEVQQPMPAVADTQMVPAGVPQPLVVQQQPPPPEMQQPPQPEEQQQMNRYDPSAAPIPAGRDHGAVNRQDPESNYVGRDADTPRHVEEARDRQQAQIGRELQRTAAVPGASPLPKPELVRKKGFVLSRISFRTIVMKKWKQAYWVQYGPHTMLWFRSQTDFNDWLNNPYHNQAQRNFLIKLAVNFVHDLYKPSVRGYQVTQCRTKPYGSKMIRQFKLERWMDYGPTIAAAFGSYNPKEVDDLRQAIVECMRNTPLNNGIRATGAVRQQASHSSDEADAPNQAAAPPSPGEGQPHQPHQEMQPAESQDSDRRQYASADGAIQQGAHDIEKEGKESDLLDLDNWEEVSVQDHSVVPYIPGQGAPPTPGVPPAAAAAPGQNTFASSPQQPANPNPYAALYGGPPPQPAFPSQPAAYAAQPPQVSQEFAAPPPQGSQEFVAPPQASQEFAAPPAQQQPNLYGAPPPQPQPTPYGAPPPPSQPGSAPSQANPFGAQQPPQQTF